MSKRKRKNRVPRGVAETVIGRSGGDCELMSYTSGCNGRAQQLHHRKLRSQGGEHTVSNLVAICEPCHRWLHSLPAVSYTNGYLVKSVKDPSDVPFERRGILMYLLPDGTCQQTNVEPLEV